MAADQFRVCAGCNKTQPYARAIGRSSLLNILPWRIGGRRFVLNSVKDSNPEMSEQHSAGMAIGKLLKRQPRLVHEPLEMPGFVALTHSSKDSSRLAVEKQYECLVGARTSNALTLADDSLEGRGLHPGSIRCDDTEWRNVTTVTGELVM